MHELSRPEAPIEYEAFLDRRTIMNIDRPFGVPVARWRILAKRTGVGGLLRDCLRKGPRVSEFGQLGAAQLPFVDESVHGARGEHVDDIDEAPHVGKALLSCLDQKLRAERRA